MTTLGETLGVIAAPSETVKVQGGTREIAIRKASLGRLKPVTDLLNSVFKELEVDEKTGLPQMFNTFADSKGNLVRTVNVAEVILQLIADNFEKAAEVAFLYQEGYATLEEFLDADLDDTMAVIVAIIELNKAFFISRVLPLVQRLLPVAAGAVPETQTAKSGETAGPSGETPPPAISAEELPE